MLVRLLCAVGRILPAVPKKLEFDLSKYPLLRKLSISRSRATPWALYAPHLAPDPAWARPTTAETTVSTRNGGQCQGTEESEGTAPFHTLQHPHNPTGSPARRHTGQAVQMTTCRR